MRSFSFGSAPQRSSSSTVCMWPFAAAPSSAVRPVTVAELTSAPSCTSWNVTSSMPRAAASRRPSFHLRPLRGWSSSSARQMRSSPVSMAERISIRNSRRRLAEEPVRCNGGSPICAHAADARETRRRRADDPSAPHARAPSTARRPQIPSPTAPRRARTATNRKPKGREWSSVRIRSTDNVRRSSVVRALMQRRPEKVGHCPPFRSDDKVSATRPARGRDARHTTASASRTGLKYGGPTCPSREVVV